MTSNLQDRNLGKWPLLLVKGSPVTRDQASEILLRTDQWHLFSNDRAWCREVAYAIGVAVKDERASEPVDYKELRQFTRRIGALELEYLGNDQIMSAWVGGPHGWCSWNGNIGCDHWNIGKWPTVEAVQRELDLIAKTFPYLDMTVQLAPEEGKEPPAVEWKVKGGKAKLGEVTEPLEPLGMEKLMGLCAGRISNPHGERGVSLSRLREALAQVLA